MGDVEITVHNDEPEETPEETPEEIAEELPPPVVVPVAIPTPDSGLDHDELSDLRVEIAALGGRLDSIQAFIERIELAEAIDGTSDEEALDTLAELADLEKMEEETHESTTEAGETPQTDGTPNQQDGSEAVGEDSRDERPRATHPWWRSIRN